MNPSRRPWVALLVICLAVFSTAVAAFAIPPIIGALAREFHITYSEAGLFMTVYTMVPAFGSMLIGWFKDRAGIRVALLTGLSLLAIAGLGSSLSQDFGQMLGCRVLLGVGATCVLVPGMATVLYLLPTRHVNFATGAFFSSMNLGLSAALLVTPIMAASSGWRLPLQLFAILPVAMIMVLLFKARRNFFRPANETTARDAERAPQPAQGSTVPLALVGAGNFFLFFQAFAMITWLPDYLKVERGFTPAQEGFVSMLLGLVVIPGSILAGWLADRVGAWLVGIAGASLCALCPVLLVAVPHAGPFGAAINISFLALGTSLLTIPLTSVLSQLVSHEHGGKAAGLIATTGYFGAIVSTYGGGYLLTATGSHSSTFVACTVTMVLTIILLVFLRGTYKRLEPRDRTLASSPADLSAVNTGRIQL